MPTFRIEWENDLYSLDSPLEAARECREDIINGESLMFTVTNLSTGEKFSVDLSEPEEDAVLPI